LSDKILTPESKVRELFEIVMPADGASVVPVRLSEVEDEKQKLMVLIAGDKEGADLLLANIMLYVDGMYTAAREIEAQEEANKSDIAHIIS
jgi:hypothetical protein